MIQCYGTEKHIDVAENYYRLGMLQIKQDNLFEARINLEKSL